MRAGRFVILFVTLLAALACLGAAPTGSPLVSPSASPTTAPTTLPAGKPVETATRQQILTLDTGLGQLLAVTVVAPRQASPFEEADNRPALTTTSLFRFRPYGSDTYNYQPFAKYAWPIRAIVPMGELGGRTGQVMVLVDETVGGERRTRMRLVYSTASPFELPEEHTVPSLPRRDIETDDGPGTETRIVLDLAADVMGRRLLAIDDTGDVWAMPSKSKDWQLVDHLELPARGRWDLGSSGNRVAYVFNDEGTVTLGLLGTGTVAKANVDPKAIVRLVDGPVPGGPTLLVATDTEIKLLRLLSGELAETAVELPASDEASASVVGAGLAGNVLRIVRAPAEAGEDDALTEFVVDPTTFAALGTGDEPTEVKLPTSAIVPPGSWIVQLALIGLVVLAIIGLLRQQPPQEAEIQQIGPMLAPLRRRLAAGLIDAVPLLTGFALSSAIQLPDDSVVPTLVPVAGVVTYIAFILAFEVTTGRSLGKMMLGLRVSATNGTTPTTRAIVIRNVLRLLDGPGLAMILLTPLRQRLGDLLARTVVVLAADSEVEPLEDEPAT